MSDQGMTAHFLRALLPFTWLRPERSLVDAYQLSAVASLLPEPLPQPSMEFGCTDGVCTFVLLGGQADFLYDDYVDVPVPSSEVQIEDYFEVALPMTRDVVIHPARETITYGLSWKAAHLERASRLSLYENLMSCSLDSQITLADKSLEFVWAPNLFQVKPEHLDSTIASLKRVLNDDGMLLTILPDVAQKQCELFQRLSTLPGGLRETLDRGISRNLTMNARSHEEWTAVFEQHNLQVQEHIQFLPKLAGDIYQIGFRPMFPVLLKAYALLRSGDTSEFLNVKRQWIDTEYSFLEALCNLGPESGDLGKPLWHAYQLINHG